MSFTVRKMFTEQAEEAFDLATQVFVRASTLHRACGIELAEYRRYLRPQFDHMIAQGLSLAAVDDATQRLAGCLIATDFAAQELDAPMDGKFSPIAALAAALASRYRQFRRFAKGEVMLVDMAAVSDASEGQGVYQALRAEAQVLARARGFQFVVGELSSAATQHVVLNRLHHVKRAEIDFASFQWRGDYPFRAIAEPPSVILSEGRL